MTTAPQNSSAGEREQGPQLAVFEFSHLGHYPYYLRLLIRHRLQRPAHGTIDFVITPRFARDHTDVVELAASAGGHGMTFHLITKAEQRLLDAGRTSTTTSLSALLQGRVDSRETAVRRWILAAHYAERLGATHALFTHLDSCLLPAASGQAFPCPFSGILFRPAFHYPGQPGATDTTRENLQRAQEKLLYRRATTHPGCRWIFCLDRLAVEPLRQEGADAVFLPDPVPAAGKGTAGRARTLRRELGAADDALLLLFFGDVSARKGITQFLDALRLLSDDDCSRLFVVVAGAVKSFDEDRLRSRIEALRNRPPLVWRAGYVPENKVGTYFDAADIVVAPYQHHIGMSGVMLRAAAHGKPLLTQDYGLMGQLTREYGLGLAVDTRDPYRIATAIRRCIDHAPGRLADSMGMSRLAAEHAEPQFADTILNCLLPRPA